ncbi:pilus assembly protein [Corallococcus sp. AB049A]|uniref:Pilus assembly protein n=1 Tax=Corallococcus interemptor TaxID=2316720 RepID=A0A3A8QN58_9BACT|nr:MULTISPECIES: TadE family protein [Corallococcus]RKH49160.1 pilus assembly protein [Corallococcus sp. AB050B]RKH66292.1 pilus assembly protein [Corallococcus interemptor]RKI70958.1 pilus assembly protein [Corallococcus sp. AB049A]
MQTETSGRQGESGQAAVESALVVPLMVFLILGTLQLTTLHHARLMTEYAAYRAVRTGIVNHGNCPTMERAAYMALVPTLGPPRTGGRGRADTLVNAMDVHDAYTLWHPDVNQYFPGSPLKRVLVEVLNPEPGKLNGLFSTYGSHLGGKEIDFDDYRDATVIEANLLSVRVTYFYELRIPFANWQLHSFYMGREVLGQLKGVGFLTQKAPGGGSASQYLEQDGASRGNAYFKELARLAGAQTYAIPIVATSTMRMQSNLIQGAWGPGACPAG